MNVTPSRVESCARWIKHLDADALGYLRRLLEEGEGDPTGVSALLPDQPPLKEGGAEAPLAFEEER